MYSLQNASSYLIVPSMLFMLYKLLVQEILINKGKKNESTCLVNCLLSGVSAKRRLKITQSQYKNVYKQFNR